MGSGRTHAARRLMGWAGPAALLLLLLIAFGLWPRAREAGVWLMAADDPPALATLRLREALTPERLAVEVTAALDGDDVDLAESFLALAADAAIPVPAHVQDRYASMSTTSASLARGARDFLRGALSGDASTDAALTGSVAGDLAGVGDVRDLLSQGRKLLNGEEPDAVVTGIAAAGLVITGATIASLGSTSPVRAGLTGLKVAIRSGRMSRPLLTELTGTLRAAVDTRVLRAGAASALAFDTTAARTSLSAAINPAAVAKVRQAAGDLASIGRHARMRGALDAAALAETTGDLRRLSHLATTFGARTRATLKLLGRGAIVLGAQAAALAAWLVSALAVAVVVLLSALTLLQNAIEALVLAQSHRRRARRARQPQEPAATVQGFTALRAA